MTKFAATYGINKYSDGDGGYAYELLDLQTMFETVYEEDETVGEWTDTYDQVKGYLDGKPEGVYSVFVVGSIDYSVDYQGEHDIDVGIEYHSVTNVPEEYYGEYGEDE